MFSGLSGWFLAGLDLRWFSKAAGVFWCFLVFCGVVGLSVLPLRLASAAAAATGSPLLISRDSAGASPVIFGVGVMILVAAHPWNVR